MVLSDDEMERVDTSSPSLHPSSTFPYSHLSAFLFIAAAVAAAAVAAAAAAVVLCFLRRLASRVKTVSAELCRAASVVELLVTHPGVFSLLNKNIILC